MPLTKATLSEVDVLVVQNQAEGMQSLVTRKVFQDQKMAPQAEHIRLNLGDD